MSNSKKLNPFWATMALRLIVALKYLVGGKIPDGPAKEAWLLTLEPTEKIIDALSDEDPENGKQILVIVKKHTNEKIIPFGESQFANLINKIKDDRIRDLVLIFAALPFKVGEVFTDENPNNEEQLKTELEIWAEDPRNQDLLLSNVLGPLLRSLFKNQPFLADLIIDTVNDQIQNLNLDINGDGE